MPKKTNKKNKKSSVSMQKILSLGVLLLGIILVTESLISTILLIDTTALLSIDMLVINWLYLSIKTITGLLFLIYGIYTIRK